MSDLIDGITIKEKSITDLQHATLNPVKRSEKAKKAIKDSIGLLGMGRSILTSEDENGQDVIIAGNGTIEQARELGIERVIEIETDGKSIISVKRKDLSEEEQLQMALFDNYTAKNANFDKESLQEYVKLGIDTEPVLSAEDLDKLAFSKKEKSTIDESSFDDSDPGLYLLVTCDSKELQESVKSYLEEEIEGISVIAYEGKKRS